MNINRLILGSSSKFRYSLLKSTGIKFEIAASKVNEKEIQAETPQKLATQRALSKGESIAKNKENTIVIGADQVCSLDNNTFDKAFTREQAKQRLLEFSGKTHYLHSAFSIIASGKLEDKPSLLYQEVIDVPMTMRTLSPEEINSYLDTEEWMGCVGCYQFENRGIHLFDKVGGDYPSIIGLPLIPLVKSLRSIGIDPLINPNGPWKLTLPK